VTTTKRIPSFIRKLTSEIRRETGAQKISVEKVPGLSRYRVAVVSPKFSRKSQLARQDWLWQIVDRSLTPPEQMRLSLILAYSPKELGLKPKPAK
jgi:stress-induced morphogen